MERVAVPSSGPSSGPSFKPSPHADQPLGVEHRRACLTFVLLVSLLRPSAGLTGFTVDHRISELWAIGAPGFLALSLVWERPRHELLGVLAYLVAVFAVTALLLGHGVAEAAWWAVAGAGQSVLLVLIYRRLRRDRGWAPTTEHHLAALLVAAAASNLALALVGGFPHLPPGHLSVVMGWWVLRGTVSCFIPAVTFLTLFHWDQRDVLPPSSVPNLMALVGAAGLGVWGTYNDPSQPQSWLMLVPFVWAGLTLTPRGTAALSLGVVLGAAVVTVLPRKHFGYAGLLPASSMVDLLLIASIGAAMLLTLMRDQRGRLIAELDERTTEAEAQGRLLEMVFDGITDGALIAEPAGVLRFNSAARQLIGRAMPQDRPDSWAAAFGARDLDGRLVDDDDLRAALGVAEHVPGTHEYVLGDAGDERIVEVTARPLEWDQRQVTLVLLHDVTATRQRVQALREFAGVVAHDVRGPLTRLEGWLELVADGRASGDRALVEEGLSRAQEAAARMRQVIEDWLNYTVVRDAALRPEPVPLTEVVDEIARTYARGDQDAAPTFALDLAHVVCADRALLRQIVDNLVGNAVKYAPAERPPLITIRSSEDDEPGWIRIEVEDDGIGIPEGQEETIFEEFRRGNDTGGSPGTGLGLALTRRIVVRHGGRIAARRNPTGGSTFSFTLPAA
ncbi:MAG: sensor histidine kinase [Marmoricola sp.]